MKKNHFLFCLTITLFYTGCVSIKKFNILKSELAEKKSEILKLKNDSTNFISSIKFLNIENQKLNTQINKLNISVENMSTKNKILEDINLLPTIPIPPPLPTSYLILSTTKMNKFKKYSQIDTMLSKAFISNQYDKSYLAVQNGGFAIATNFEEIDKNGNKVLNKPSSKNSILDFFSKRINGLFFSKTGFFRSVIFIVAPNVETLGGQTISYDQIQAWINVKGIKLPDLMGNELLPKNFQVIALLYEFEQNENNDVKVQILNSSNSKTNLSEHPIIKTLNYGD